ncbi:flavin reductase [Panacibacter sp. DH6]|uniref:Flavin reductase n=1 Tax=Panacibacter microcysteis TaxID=2793269 RepID=A0A931E1D0_9BACT|nr:flavin reductase [Panacibacter microcysteis]MBG9376822.1 flavin reductase [Panacibacter microcysteis]
MISYKAADIQQWERFYRANFINSLTGFKSISLIGTANTSGNTNLGLFSSIVHMGSDPALVGFINRPLKAAPHTIDNIKATGVYTINHVHESFLEPAHQASAKYPESVSEFDETGLTPEYIDHFTAPFVKESAIKYALTMQEIIPITLNDTFLVIGKIDFVQLEAGVLRPDGFLDIDKAGSLCSNGADAYYNTAFIARYKYAKPGILPEKI